MSETYTSLCSKTTLVMVGEQSDATEKNEPGRVEGPKLQKIRSPDDQVEEKIDSGNTRPSDYLEPKDEHPSSTENSLHDTSNDESTEPKKRKTCTCNSGKPGPNQCFTPEEVGRIFADVDKLW